MTKKMFQGYDNKNEEVVKMCMGLTIQKNFVIFIRI